jgi:hypothetical protein
VTLDNRLDPATALGRIAPAEPNDGSTRTP